MAFQAPTSLAGTLTRLASNGKSVNRSPTPPKVTVCPEGNASSQQDSPASNTIYQRSLPSLHFLRWRPMYHMIASNAWMNDPCAPGFDPSTGLYHLFFQWNPRRNIYGKIAWGTIAWGHATSKDLIHWTVSGSPALEPSAWYDKEGCFTGCMLPTSIDGAPGALTIMYTGANKLPLHYTLPYQRGAETLNLAESRDGGATWRKYKSNPIHPEPPVGLTVSGWRDPYVAPWPSLDQAMGRVGNQDTLYAIVSGGLKDQTPTAFLYEVNKTNLAHWEYICPLVDLGLNHILSRWSGDMGVNWECANFMTITDPQENVRRDFIVVGGEGSKNSQSHSTFAEHPQQITKFPRDARSLQWMCGTLVPVLGKDDRVVPRMEYKIGGRFDHGCLYGVNSFLDPVTLKQIAWGWVTEEDLPQSLVERQNWSGLLSLPRELSLQCLRHVNGALVSNLNDITSIEIEPTSDNTCTVRTLGISPAKHLEALRQNTQELVLQGPVILTSSAQSSLDVHSCRFELSAVLSVSDTCSRIGLSIFPTQDMQPTFANTIYLTPPIETLTIERPNSAHVDPAISTAPETAPFTLFTFATPQGGIRENLEIRAWFDESVLEVFANDRCTFATRIYPATKRCWGVRFWAEDEMEASQLVQARAWDGLRADIRVS